MCQRGLLLRERELARELRVPLDLDDVPRAVRNRGHATRRSKLGSHVQAGHLNAGRRTVG